MATNLTRLQLRARGSGAKQQIKAGSRASRYLSAESCTHSAAGKSGSDSHRPKPSAMARDPVRPGRPRGLETARRGSARRAARERAGGRGWECVRCGFGARFWRGRIRLVGGASRGSVALLVACSSSGGLSPCGLVVHEQAVLQVILQNRS
jgi:hypothetical protein